MAATERRKDWEAALFFQASGWPVSVFDREEVSSPGAEGRSLLWSLWRRRKATARGEEVFLSQPAKK